MNDKIGKKNGKNAVGDQSICPHWKCKSMYIKRMKLIFSKDEYVEALVSELLHIRLQENEAIFIICIFKQN